MEYGDPKDLLFFDGIQIAPTGACTYVPLLEMVPLANLQGSLNTCEPE
jgi:hypothetical protein